MDPNNRTAERLAPIHANEPSGSRVGRLEIAAGMVPGSSMTLLGLRKTAAETRRDRDLRNPQWREERKAHSITASLKANEGRVQSVPPARLSEWGQPVPIWGRGGDAGVSKLDGEAIIHQMEKKLTTVSHTLAASLWVQEASKLSQLAEGKQRRKDKLREQGKAARHARKPPKRPGSYY